MNEALQALQTAMDENNRGEIVISAVRVQQLVEDGHALTAEDFAGLSSDILGIMLAGGLLLVAQSLS